MTAEEKVARAMMQARRPNGTPILCLDPDFDELPADEAGRLEDDDFTQEDVLALARAALAV